jgi:nitrate/TMAO reductase-like tetraheme cytochrome c subunit
MIQLNILFSIISQAHAASGGPQEGITGVEFARILGIGLSILVLALILFVVARYRKTLMHPTARWLHLLSLCIVPAFILFLGNFVAYEEAKELNFCASCHPVMDPYVNDLKDPKSNTLASIHNQNRYIQEAQCYACHVGYGLGGTMQAKINGLIHLYKYLSRYTFRFYTGTYTIPIKMYEPFPNSNCLRCHTAAKKFEEKDVHVGIMTELTSNAMSCLDCHGPPHPPQVASQKPEGGKK